MLRFIFCLTIEAIWFLLTLPLVGIALLIGLINKPIQYAIGRFVTQSVSVMLYIFNGAKLTVKGQEHIPDNETVLFVGNHRSLIDIPLLLKTSKKTIGFVGKDSLKKTPGVNLWMILLGSLFLDRTNLRKGAATIKQGIAYLKEGHNLVVFPEGTRSKTGELLPFKQGSMKLALKSGVRIVPFAIRGTGDMFEENNYRFKKQKVQITYSKPIDLNALDKETQKKCADDVQMIVQNMLNEMDH